MKRNNKRKGYTLLEYAAGAAVLMGILYAGLNTMGSGVRDLLDGVGQWASSQKSNLTSGTTGK